MFNRSKKKENAGEAAAVVVPSNAPVSAGNEVSAEIIAVITAAIAAMTGNGAASSDGFVVRKISRISGEKISWNTAGLMECMDSRKF